MATTRPIFTVDMKRNTLRFLEFFGGALTCESGSTKYGLTKKGLHGRVRCNLRSK